MSTPPVPPGIAPVVPNEARPDLAPLQEDWDTALATLLESWLHYTADQVVVILDAVEGIVSSGDVLGLLDISVSSLDAAAALQSVMQSVGSDAGQRVVAEAKAQGMADGDVHLVGPDKLRTAQSAQLYATQTADFLIKSAVSETMRVWSRGSTPSAILDRVAGHVRNLTDAYPRLVLGGALTQAQHDGRTRTIMGGPEAALYADEILDSNTCGPCADVNRKWIGNASDPMPPLVYPVAGYVDCKGRWRCRGQVIAVWRGGDDWTKWIEQPGQRTGP